MLERLARTCYRRRWAVLALWVVALVGTTVLAGNLGGETSMEFELPSSDSQQAFDLLKESGTGQQNETGKIVFAADDVTAPGVVERAEAFMAEVAAVDHVESVAGPFEGTPRSTFQISRSKQVAYAEIQFDGEYPELPRELGPEIEELAEGARSDSLRIELSGQVFQDFEVGGASELVGLLAAVVILLLAFGSVLAMGLPILMALFGIGIGLALVQLLANWLSVPDFATQLAAMIGIGVGIDYALFIVTRYRQLLHDGRDPEAAVVLAVKTAGKAVLFAGCTVVISLLGMFLVRISFVNGLAVGASLAVLVTMLASVTLLPAVLGFVGHRIDSLALPWAKRTTAGDRNVWYRWSRFVQRHPVVMATVGFVVLFALAIPVFHIRLGSADDGNMPESSTLRKSYDLLSEGFGPGFNGQVLIAVRVPDDAAGAALPQVQAAVAGTDGVAFASPPQWEAGSDVAIIGVFPATSPQSEETVRLIERLRSDTLPDVTEGTGLQAHVGGVTALFDDVAGILSDRLPLFIAGVLSLSFLLLLAVFRSIFVPLKAVVVNLLSIGASYGLLVLVFQDGVGASLIGVGKEGPIEAFVPMMMFAIVFGLSMDYEVFLLSRIKEEYDHTNDNAVAVADGLSHTARVITAAAAIMVCVFGAFVFGDNRAIKSFGFGLAVAVAIDATIVRMILVPATMELLGDRNWWFPRWLERWVPKIHIEGDPEDRAEPPPAAPSVGDDRSDDPDDDLVGAGSR